MAALASDLRDIFNISSPAKKTLIKLDEKQVLDILHQRKTDGKIGQPAQRHSQNGMENINLQYKNNVH